MTIDGHQPVVSLSSLGNGEQICSEGIADAGGDQVTALSGDADHRRRPIDIWTLVGGSPVRGVGRNRLDDDLHLLADPVLRPLGDEPSTRAVTRSTRSAISSAGSLSSKSGRLGAVLVGVAEHADHVQPGCDEERLQGAEVGLGFAETRR